MKYNFSFLLKALNILKIPQAALSGLRQFLATENPLKNDEKCFLYHQGLSWLFGHVSKRIGQKDKVNFKFHDITT